MDGDIHFLMLILNCYHHLILFFFSSNSSNPFDSILVNDESNTPIQIFSSMGRSIELSVVVVVTLLFDFFRFRTFDILFFFFFFFIYLLLLLLLLLKKKKKDPGFWLGDCNIVSPWQRGHWMLDKFELELELDFVKTPQNSHFTLSVLEFVPIVL